MTDTLRVTFDLPLTPAAAFETVVEELAAGLGRRGIRFEPGPEGRVVEGDFVVGEVSTWEASRRVAFRWRPASWEPAETSRLTLSVEAAGSGTLVTLEHTGLGRFAGRDAEPGGWLAGEVLAGVLSAAAPGAFGDWFTDRHARRPSGAQARATYADPLYHYPNFRVILAELALGPDDYLVEVGCGGGALLEAALATGCRAAAIDHSPDMVRVARSLNAAAIADGRLDVREGAADALPFGDGTFTAAAMTGVLGFLPDPVAAFAEIRRVLRPDGRFVALGSDPEMRGTPAAPEPMASRLQFYDDDGLEGIARAAGFSTIAVVRRDLAPFAREAGVPEEHLPLFAADAGGGARFLVCRR